MQQRGGWARKEGKIVVADRIDASATRTWSELNQQGVETLKVLADVSTFSGAQTLMRQALDAYGRIDVLVNNVGGTIWIKPYHLYSDGVAPLKPFLMRQRKQQLTPLA